MVNSKVSRGIVVDNPRLSGVPRSTLYDWRLDKVYVPDYEGAKPYAWSYRDLVFLRLLAWLRQLGMPRPSAAANIATVRRRATEHGDVRTIRTDERSLVLNEEHADSLGPNLT
ncbi:MAG: hypothetical protein ACRD2W_04610 [Acidimicrobiales bacterium]